MRKFWFFTVVLVVGCGPSLGDKLDNLGRAKHQWSDTVGSKAYSFLLTRHCECKWSGNPLKVSVELAVSSFDNVAADEYFAYPNGSSSLPNMPGIFDFLLTLHESESRAEGTLVVRYDSELGYPKDIEWIDQDSSNASFQISIGEVKVE